MMELCFTGTSGAICNNGNSNISFFCRTADSLLLVDCPGDLSLKAEKCDVDLLDLDALILTHSHPDHLYGLPQLIQHFILTGRTRRLQIAANPATVTTAQALLDLFHQNADSLDFPIEWILAEQKTVFTDPAMQVMLLPVEHSIPTSGVFFKLDTGSILYSGDTKPDALERYAHLRPAVLIHEASGLAGDERRVNERDHSSTRQAARSAVAAGVSALYLCHFSDSSPSYLENIRTEAERDFPGDVIIPELYRSYTF